ncbi:MAG: hypothetical protein ABFS17_13355 [Chloroflexota bacterium]
MNDIISFFTQYENTLYYVLAVGMIVFGWKFYGSWRELRGSVYGLEQTNAQRRLNNAAVGMFLLFLMGFVIFSLVTFVPPGLNEDIPGNEIFTEADLNQTQDEAAEVVEQPENEFATATPLPTVVVDLQACTFTEEDDNKITITSPRANQEVRGLVEVTGIVDVVDFGFYKLEIAQVSTGLWLPITVGETMILEEAAIVVFDSSFYPPGDYVLQLVVTKHDVEEYPPCRIPIRIAQSN